MSGTWKGADKPAGCHFYVPAQHFKYDLDCPWCKFGTLTQHPNVEIMYCIDCKSEFTKSQLIQLGVLKSPPVINP
jgi:hypothetical protein